MDLQTNGLPPDAVFVGLLSPKKGQYFIQGGDCVLANYDWEYWTKVVVEFTTYGMPLYRVDLKGREMLGKGMKTAWGYPTSGMDYVAADGTIKTAKGDENREFIRLEPMFKKRKVLMFELPIEYNSVEGGQVYITGHLLSVTRIIESYGGVVKEVDDSE